MANHFVRHDAYLTLEACVALRTNCAFPPEVCVPLPKRAFCLYTVRMGDNTLGLTLAEFQNTIFLQFCGCRHLFDMVATTLHELGHQMVLRTPHYNYCKDTSKGHCIVWERCTKILMRLFASAPKSTQHLRTLTRDYGAYWEYFVVQGVKSCPRCDRLPVTIKDSERQCKVFSSTYLCPPMEKQEEEVIMLDDEDDTLDLTEDPVDGLPDLENGWQVHLLDEDDDEDIEFWLWRFEKMGCRFGHNLKNYKRKPEKTTERSHACLSQNHFHLEMVLHMRIANSPKVTGGQLMQPF